MNINLIAPDDTFQLARKKALDCNNLAIALYQQIEYARDWIEVENWPDSHAGYFRCLAQARLVDKGWRAVDAVAPFLSDVRKAGPFEGWAGECFPNAHLAAVQMAEDLFQLVQYHLPLSKEQLESLPMPIYPEPPRSGRESFRNGPAPDRQIDWLARMMRDRAERIAKEVLSRPCPPNINAEIDWEWSRARGDYRRDWGDRPVPDAPYVYHFPRIFPPHPIVEVAVPDSSERETEDAAKPMDGNQAGSAEGAIGDAADAAWLERVLAIAGDKTASAMLNVAQDTTKTADQKMRAIYAIDNRVLGWTSGKWETVLRVSDAAVRQTDWWKYDRKRLTG